MVLPCQLLAVLLIVGTTLCPSTAQPPEWGCPDHDAVPAGALVKYSGDFRFVSPDADTSFQYYYFRVERKIGGVYKPVCNGLTMNFDNFQDVACTSIGMEASGSINANYPAPITCPYYYPDTTPATTYSALNFDCDGTETELEDCAYDSYVHSTHSTYCDQGHGDDDLIVYCYIDETHPPTFAPTKLPTPDIAMLQADRGVAGNDKAPTQNGENGDTDKYIYAAIGGAGAMLVLVVGIIGILKSHRNARQRAAAITHKAMPDTGPEADGHTEKDSATTTHQAAYV